MGDFRRRSDLLYGTLRGASIRSQPQHAIDGPHITAYAAAMTTCSGHYLRVDLPLASATTALAAEQSAASATEPVRRNVWALALALVIVVAFIAAAVVMVVVGGPTTPGGVSQLWTVLITGLTTGGLSCLAVQGGLLASSLNSDNDDDVTARPEHVISSFLVAKVVAYTLLGALLGLFGSAVQLSVTARGVMQLGIGIFMLLTGIRMVRPYRWLNFVVLEPPPPVRRLIRRVSRRDNALTTPIFLGALTVMIPCGVTQAMMALAITTANPIAGAVTMAVFTLATSPMFFSISLAANTIGKQFERQFNRIVAVLILILGYVAIQSGAALIGHPLPFRPLFTNLAPKTAQVSAMPNAGTGKQSIDVTVHVDGYTPNNVAFGAGRPATLVLVTDHITGCTRTINIPSLNLQQPLAITGRTPITIPAQKPGTHMEWVCGMGMFTGTITFK